MKQYRSLSVGAIFAVLIVAAAVGYQHVIDGNPAANSDIDASVLNSETVLGSDAQSFVEPADGNNIVQPQTVRAPKFAKPSEAFRPEQADSEENIERFGEFVWPEAKNDKTLFFHRGQYIDAPYVVSTRGLAVFVNDHQVDVKEWPHQNYLAEKPPLPAGLTAESTPHDLVRARRLRESWPIMHARWVNSHFAPRPRETREQALLRAYKELPFVAETGVRIVKDDFVGERRLLWFRTTTGEEKGIVSRSMVHGTPPKDPELILKDLHFLGHQYLQIVRSGGLQYRDGWTMASISEDSLAWLWLPEAIEVLDADSTPSNKERKLRVLLNHETGVAGSVESMISAWASKFQPTRQLRKRIEQIRRERTKSPKWQAPPELPEDVPEPQPEPQTDGPEHEARQNLDTAIAEMIELLEKGDFKNFVERYIQRQYRGQYKYEEDAEFDPEVNYDFTRQPEIVALYIQNLKWAQQVEPLMEGNEAIFVHWLGRGPLEFHLKTVRNFWYFR